MGNFRDTPVFKIRRFLTPLAGMGQDDRSRPGQLCFPKAPQVTLMRSQIWETLAFSSRVRLGGLPQPQGLLAGSDYHNQSH